MDTQPNTWTHNPVYVHNPAYGHRTQLSKCKKNILLQTQMLYSSQMQGSRSLFCFSKCTAPEMHGKAGIHGIWPLKLYEFINLNTYCNIDKAYTTSSKNHIDQSHKSHNA